MKEELRRAEAVDLVLSGKGIREVAHRLKRSPSWVLRWVRRFGTGMSWNVNRSRKPHRSPGRLSSWLEGVIVNLRRELQAKSRVQCGAQAIQYILAQRGVRPLPSVRLIGKVIQRQGLVQRRKGRFPRKGIPYPQVAPAGALVQAADVVGPRYIQDAGRFYSLHVMLICSRQVGLEPRRHLTDPVVQEAFWAIWCRLGLPQYLQMDNKTPFAPSVLNPLRLPGVLRLILDMGIQPIFIPQAEPWRNGHIERFNGTYDRRFFRMERFGGYQALVLRTRGFETDHNRSWRYSTMQNRTPDALGASLELSYPPSLNPPKPPRAVPPGQIHVIRFVRSDRRIDIFGQRLRLPARAQYRYVHAQISTGKKTLEILLDGNPIKSIPWNIQ